jgi:hypothetical protein
MSIATATVLLFTLTVSGQRFAGGRPTQKITIEGAALATAVNISDPSIRDFEVWSGLGTQSWSGEPGQGTRLDNGEGFIVEWLKGSFTDRPSDIETYKVSFHVNYQGKESPYTVTYGYNPSTREGYVYLPGKGEQAYALNTSMIYRGVEGKWLRATSKWNEFVIPIIDRAKTRK